MTSETPVGCVCQMGELLLRPVGDAAPVTVVAAVVVWMHCTRGGCYWTRVGCTLGRWGLRAVRTTLGQWIPPLVEQADPRRDSKRSRRPTMTTGPQRRRRAGDGGEGPVTEAPGRAARTPDSLLRGLVSTALTLPSLPPKNPAEIVGILRFLSGVQRRYGVNVSAVDTSGPPDFFPSPHPRLQDHQPAQSSRPSESLRSEETAQYPEPSTARHKVRPRRQGRRRRVCG